MTHFGSSKPLKFSLVPQKVIPTFRVKSKPWTLAVVTTPILYYSSAFFSNFICWYVVNWSCLPPLSKLVCYFLFAKQADFPWGFWFLITHWKKASITQHKLIVILQTPWSYRLSRCFVSFLVPIGKSVHRYFVTKWCR